MLLKKITISIFGRFLSFDLFMDNFPQLPFDFVTDVLHHLIQFYTFISSVLVDCSKL